MVKKQKIQAKQKKLQLNKFYHELTATEKSRFELAAIDDFAFWSRYTWCQFIYIYKDNEKNRILGRAGTQTAIRFGTRNLDLVPPTKRPKNYSKNVTNIRYFDTGKFGTNLRDYQGKFTTAQGQIINGLWRSCGRDKVVVLLKIWSFQRQKFVTDFADFYDKTQQQG